MDVLAIILAFICALSLAANGLLAYQLKTRLKAPPREPDYECRELLHDLTTKGAALVKVTRVDSSNLFVFGRTHT